MISAVQYFRVLYWFACVLPMYSAVVRREEKSSFLCHAHVELVMFNVVMMCFRCSNVRSWFDDR